MVFIGKRNDYSQDSFSVSAQEHEGRSWCYIYPAHSSVGYAMGLTFRDRAVAGQVADLLKRWSEHGTLPEESP